MHAEISSSKVACYLQFSNVQLRSMCIWRERKSKRGKMLTAEQLINLDGMYRIVSCNIL